MTRFGVLLSWDHLLRPVSLNFVQYRLISNITAARAFGSSNAFTTLDLSFRHADQKEAFIPISLLAAGQHYEFRMGFPYVGFTYYSNSQFVKTFGAGSGYVGQVQWTSTNETIRVWWEAPEDTEGLIGIRVQLCLKEKGNGRLKSPSWSDDELVLVRSVELSAVSEIVELGCQSGPVSCLYPNTFYAIDIVTHRSTSVSLTKRVYASTKAPVVSSAPQDTAKVYSWAEGITLSFVEPISVSYPVGTPLTQTFLHPAYVKNKDISILLNTSVVGGSSALVLNLTLGLAELRIAAAYSTRPDYVYSRLFFQYGPEGRELLLSPSCMGAFGFHSDLCRPSM